MQLQNYESFIVFTNLRAFIFLYTNT